MFIVLVGGRPQAYNGRSLASCSRGVCLFASHDDAEEAATKTLEIAKKNYPQWGILQYGYEIVKLAYAGIAQYGPDFSVKEEPEAEAEEGVWGLSPEIIVCPAEPDPALPEWATDGLPPGVARYEPVKLSEEELEWVRHRNRIALGG